MWGCVAEKMHVQSTQFFHTLYVKGRLATFIKSEHCLPIEPDFFIVVMKIRICHVIVWAKFWNIGLTNWLAWPGWGGEGIFWSQWKVASLPLGYNFRHNDFLQHSFNIGEFTELTFVINWTKICDLLQILKQWAKSNIPGNSKDYKSNRNNIHIKWDIYLLRLSAPNQRPKLSVLLCQMLQVCKKKWGTEITCQLFSD